MGRGERNHMKKENNFLDLMGEIDEKFVYEASLPWKKQNVNLKLKLAKIAAAGVVIALLIGGLGHPHEIKAAWEQITSWIQTALGINENVESYIDSVGKTITKNGISITLDEIAADKENLWVAISDNINASKEKETILLTEVEINGKAAQLDGTYALEKKENGTDGQVCHYRLEDTTIKDNTADIKMKVWLFDPTEMDTADTEDTDDYIFEFSSNWEELEKNTINVNVNKKIKISPNQNLTISKMSLNDLASTIYGNLDNKEYEDYYLLGTDDKGNQGLYRMTNYGGTETVFEESRNNTKYKGISPDAKTVTLELYVNKEEKNRTTYKKYETGTEDTYGEGEGRIYESDEDETQVGFSINDIKKEVDKISAEVGEESVGISNLAQELGIIHTREENRQTGKNFISLFYYDKANKRLLVLEPTIYEIKSYRPELIKDIATELMDELLKINKEKMEISVE